MSVRQLRPLLLALWLGALAVSSVGAQPPDGNPRTAYFTVGDAQDLLEFPPLDSRVSLEAAFDSLRDQYAVDRIWWRGGQDEIWGEEFLIRPENRSFARIWEWWRDLQYRTVKTNRLAVTEAHRRGQTIWLAYGLFDHGSQAGVGYSGFPYAVEDRLRIQHPEWAPVNRWGTWHQGGPLEFAYPEAREALATTLARYVKEGGYDGIAFLTYAENFSQRYEDEFGYSPPIVDEFRRQYGVDLRRDEFDRDAWRRLRGTHVTEFLRLLKRKLGPDGPGIAVCVDGARPDQAMKWTIDGGVRTAGNWSWSIDDWLQGDVVNEICLFNPPEDAVRRDLLARTRKAGRGVQISAFRTRGDLEPEVRRVMFLGREIEAGHPNESWIDWPDEQLGDEPVSSLQSTDRLARRRLLTRALKGKVTLTADQLRQAVGDRDLYVRRLALRTIAKHPQAETRPAVTAALHDPEVTVRCLAALALVAIADDRTVPLLLERACDPETGFQFHSRAVVEALKALNSAQRFTPRDRQALVDQLQAKSSHARELALYYFTLLGAPATPEVQQHLLLIARDDANPYARELAFVNLKSSFGPTREVRELLHERMTADPDHAVQSRAAVALAQAHARLPADDPLRKEALHWLEEFLRGYGDDSQRRDRDWGWRPLGNALLDYGPAGRELLERLRSQPHNRALSDLAWRVLDLRQGDQFFPVTEEEDRAAHARHPWRR
jgi:HEAT repeat protein